MSNKGIKKKLLSDYFFCSNFNLWFYAARRKKATNTSNEDEHNMKRLSKFGYFKQVFLS